MTKSFHKLVVDTELPIQEDPRTAGGRDAHPEQSQEPGRDQGSVDSQHQGQALPHLHNHLMAITCRLLRWSPQGC